MFFTLPAVGQSKDPATGATQNLLSDPSLRQKAIAADPKAQALDQNIDRMLSGSQTDKQELYNVSAGIFGDLSAKTGGDPDKMNAVLKDALKDPDAFARSLTPEQQKKIRDLAGGTRPSGI